MSLYLAKPVFFVGFMGAGKSSVVQELARMCALPSVDLDAAIVAQEGRSVADIFAQDGQDAFRRIESALLAQVAQGEPQLVSCGGGVVERPENVRCMNKCGFVVFLDVSYEQAAQRACGDPLRPLFSDPDVASALFQRRRPLYRQAADLSLAVDERSPVRLAEAVREELVSASVLL